MHGPHQVAHLAHQFQAALDFPFLHLIGQSRVDPGDGMCALYHLHWAGCDQDWRWQQQSQQYHKQQHANENVCVACAVFEKPGNGIIDSQ